MPRPPTSHTRPQWSGSSARAELLALYAEADAVFEGWTCSCSGSGSADPVVPCCHFAVTGREPYPTAVELEEVRHAMRVGGIVVTDRRKLPVLPRPEQLELRPCPLLSDTGRCRIYPSRPLGCRTFFCRGVAEGPFGSRTKSARGAVNAVGRRIADLSARFSPRAPHPRALTRSLG